MIEYPKIETLYDRDEKFKVIPGKLRIPEFAIINNWHITEKVDGTNIRIEYKSDEQRVLFSGRTDSSQIPSHLLAMLQDVFKPDKFSVFKDGILLFGEGYGNKIQKVGSLYREGVGFVLFDVLINGLWLEPENVSDIACSIGIEHVPVHNAIHTLPESKTDLDDILCSHSVLAMKYGNDLIQEGIVARSYPMLFSRSGKRIMWKLKYKDFA